MRSQPPTIEELVVERFAYGLAMAVICDTFAYNTIDGIDPDDEWTILFGNPSVPRPQGVLDMRLTEEPE